MDYPKVKVCLDTSEDNLIDELYTPCLKWAERFDRGVGYFTTGWLTYNVAGLSDFASRGGKMRLITSPILSTEDTDAIIGTENQDGSAFLRLEAALLENVEILKQEMEADIINTFSWMLYDGIIDMRFAIPCEKLEEGDFHDKFGIFYKGNDALSFSGSINDSKHGFQNYESIKVFKTWAGTQEYVDADTARFEKIWNRKDRNLKMFTMKTSAQSPVKRQWDQALVSHLRRKRNEETHHSDNDCRMCRPVRRCVATWQRGRGNTRPSRRNRCERQGSDHCGN